MERAVHIPHLVITLGAIATATVAVLRVIDRRMTRVETATWRVAVVDNEILNAVQRDTASLN